MKNYFLPIIIVFALASSKPVSSNYAQEEIRPSKDLPITEITKVSFGAHGLMWLGTNNGLYFYDGYNYKLFSSILFDNTVLMNDHIFDIAQDDLENLFLLTGYGIEQYSPSIMQSKPLLELSDVDSINFFLYSRATSDIVFSNNRAIKRYNLEKNVLETVCVFKDSSNKIKPILIGATLWYIEGLQLLSYNLLNNTASEVSLPEVMESCFIEYIDENHLAVAINNKLFQFIIPSKKFESLGVTEDRVLMLSEIRNNRVLIATTKGIFLHEIGSSFSNETLLKSLNGASVRSLSLDTKGLAWISTNRGIFKINPDSKSFRYIPLSRGRIKYPFESSVVFESAKTGYVYQKKNNAFIFYDALEGNETVLNISSIKAACRKDDNLFLAHDKGISQFNLITKNQKLLMDSLAVNSIRIFNDTVWFAGSNGLYYLDDNKLKLRCKVQVNDFFIKDYIVYIFNNDGFSKLNNHSCSITSLISQELHKTIVNVNDILESYDGKIWIATNRGLFQFEPDSINPINHQWKLHYNRSVYSLIEAAELPEVWYSTDRGLGVINYISDTRSLFSTIDGVKQTGYFQRGTFLDKNNHINFITEKELLSFSPEILRRQEAPEEIIISTARFVSNQQDYEKHFYNPDTVILGPDIRYFTLELTTLDYYAPNNVIFEYSLTTKDEPFLWRNLNNSNELSIGRLNPGKYKLLIKATNGHGFETSTYRNITVLVKAPLLQTRWAYFLYLVSIVVMVILLIRIRTRTLRRINREYKEKERIAKKIELQAEELSVKNKNITDSINYARRIQLAMMPSIKLFSSVFPDSFVLHIPKDIVSGDFYWINQVGKKTFFSAVDCTGHGVPGAFMSIIGVELFRRITEIEGISTPADVLNSLSRNFERVFGDVDEMKLRDGMDLAFCTLNEDHTLLEFAGAFNPLYIVRNSSIMEIKGDRHSVGVYDDDDLVRSFNNHVIPLQDGDTIYIFTDGFADQFGGPEGKKYKYRRFRHLLLALHQLPLEKQKEFLRKSILEWKGDLDQVDDILVMGLKIHHKKR
jgi:serine phosphatase RsbU (regulator of sigma subunit)